MNGIGQRQWRRGRGWRAAAIGIAAAAGAAALAVAITGPVSGAPASSRAATQGSSSAKTSAATVRTEALSTEAVSTEAIRAPAGWAAVPYQDAQLSAPGSWLVEAPQELSCGYGQGTGMIFVGVKPGIPKGYGCRLSAGLAWILPAGKLRSGLSHRKPSAVLGGIPVYRLPSAKGSTLYLVPKLRVRVGARGKLAAKVLATLARSPLDVVLSRGPATRVPAGWTWRQFGGLTFATPRAWRPQREDQWATCGTGLWPRALLLIDATKPPLALPCPLQLPTASADQAVPGLVAVTGKYAAASVGESYGHCQPRAGLRICLSTATGQGGLPAGVLIFEVTSPHHAATYFLLGLSGSGRTARAAFDSIGIPRA